MYMHLNIGRMLTSYRCKLKLILHFHLKNAATMYFTVDVIMVRGNQLLAACNHFSTRLLKTCKDLQKQENLKSCYTPFKLNLI